jgi:hypothetical protein
MPQGFALLDKANLSSSLSIPQPTWTYFSNSWDQGGSFHRPRYCKDAFGFVHVQGNCYNGSGTSQTGPTFFQLPVGFRPESGANATTLAARFPVRVGTTASWVDVLADGTINLQGSATVNSTVSVHLGHIMFYAEN